MKKGVIALMILACLGLGGAFVCISMQEDKEAPEITFANEDITYIEGKDFQTLLEDVTAMDEQDGDVSDSLVVESVHTNAEKTSATAVFVARDSSNNIAKISKVINYKNSGSEDSDVATADMKESTDEQFETSENTSNTMTTEQENESDIQEENLPEGSPRITLTQSQITIGVGQSYNRIAMVEDITDDKDERNYLFTQIQIKGDDVNTNVAGTYEQIYYVVDSDGNQSNEAKLTVVVQ